MLTLILAIVFTLASASGGADSSAVSGSEGSCLLQTRAKKRKKNLGFAVGPQNHRQKKIVDMMRHTWKGYKRCWGKDELLPVDGSCSNGWHLGLTLVDSLDTLYLMGLNTEFDAGRKWVANRTAFNFDDAGTVSLFETTIRVLGGLLGAYTLSGDAVFLERARELGDHLLPAFKEHGPASPTVDLHLLKGIPSRDPDLAEATTLGLEFKTLSELTHMTKYAKAVESVDQAIHKEPKLEGLALNRVDSFAGSLYGLYKLGAGGDSYYEYLLKEWLLTGRKDANFVEDYEEAVKGIQHYLVKKTKGPLHLTYVAEMSKDHHDIDRKMDHLVCFLPGTLALGAHYGVDAAGGKPWHLDLAKDLMRTCYEMYKANGHMLAPEIALFDTEGQELFVKDADAHDLLRPETVESLFYLYRLTGDTKYQDWGWEIAQAIERYAKVEGGGYASLDSVLVQAPQKRNHMESFFSAETLKYLFLLFDDSRTQVPLDSFVFNTEAHPLRVWNGAS